MQYDLLGYKVMCCMKVIMWGRTEEFEKITVGVAYIVRK